MSELIHVMLVYHQRTIIHGQTRCARCKWYALSGNDLYETDGYWLCAPCIGRD